MSWRLRSVFDLYTSRKMVERLARRLKPLIEAERDAEDAIDAQRWTTPFRLAFLSTVIARLAHVIDPDLDSETLGRVQIELWTNLTGLPGDLAGERLLALSLSRDPAFIEGSRAGLACAEALGLADDPLDEEARARVQIWRHHLAGEA